LQNSPVRSLPSRRSTKSWSTAKTNDADTASLHITRSPRVLE
jgi:hypothetical protein